MLDNEKAEILGSLLVASVFNAGVGVLIIAVFCTSTWTSTTGRTTIAMGSGTFV
jgi:hypothetical protein